MKKFTLRNGSRIKGVEADDLGTELERIDQEYGEIQPSVVVSEAKPKRSVLHPVFEWDDTKAAEQHRLWQARHLVRSVQIVVSDGEPIPAFYHVEIEDGGGAYRTASVVMQDPNLFASAISQLRSKLAMAVKAVELAESQVSRKTPRRAKRVQAAKKSIKTAQRAIAGL